MRAPLVLMLLSSGVAAFPLSIGWRSQFFVDSWVIEQTFGLVEQGEQVTRVFHQPVREVTNPLIVADDPSYVWVTHDVPAHTFRAWFQGNVDGHTQIDYATSTDGVVWSAPVMAIPWANSPALVEGIPTADMHGFKYVLSYSRSGNLYVAGSADGLHWSGEIEVSDIPSDTHNVITYSGGAAAKYVAYVRARDTFGVAGQVAGVLGQGDTRRGIATLTSACLWCLWTAHSTTIVAPDELDDAAGYGHFYGMPTVNRSGIHWGFLEDFEQNDHVRTELAWSRDGSRFDRLPTRPTLLDFGADGSWDSTLLFVSPSYLEAGHAEWFLYYSGWNGPHSSATRVGGIGLARIRREGLVSLHGPSTGGVVVTRLLTWPGGHLYVNADAHLGALSARVVTESRMPIAGYDWADAVVFHGDETTAELTWGAHAISALAGLPIRIEFRLTDADLYTFHAALQ